MQRIFYAIVWLCLITISSYGQNIVNGKIYDAETKEPLVGATIQLASDLTIGTLTNAEGFFQLTNTTTNAPLKISMLGYEGLEVVATPERLSIALKPKVQEMQSVIITANREASLRIETPISVSKLSSKLIDETKATSLFEVVNKVPGVLMVNLNNEQHSMSIRQPMTTNGYYLYLEDGVPIRPIGVFNHNALLEMNQFAISSMEVVKGPVSSIYGPEAIGGAVNFIMQRPTAIPTAKIGLQFDNYGFRRVQFGAGARTGKFGFYVGGLSSKQTRSWMANSDYDKTSVSARLEYHFTTNTRLIGNFIYGRYFSNTAGSVDSIAFYSRNYISTTDFTYRKSDANRSRITLEHDWSKGSKTFVTLFNRNNKLGQNPSYSIRWNPTPSPTNDPRKATGQINSNDFQSYGILMQHSQQLSLLSSKLIAGGMYDYSPNEYYAYQIDLNAQLRPDGKSVEKYLLVQERPDIFIANYDATIRNAAGYLQYDFTPFTNLRVSTGIRFDFMSFSYTNYMDNTSGNKEYSQATPKVGLTYDLGHDMGIYANYSQGFSPPALTSIFNKRTNTNPAEFYYNLEPAQFQNYELGGWASLMQNKLYLDIALYQMDGTNELLNIRQPDNSFDYQSAGKTLHRGIEVGLTIKPSTEYFFRIGGTTALHRFEDFQISKKPTDKYQNLAGLEMPSAPRYSWNTEFYYYPSFVKNLRTSIEWQHVSGWYQNQINTVRYKGYDLINYRIGYQWKGVEVYTNILNLGDVLYASNATRGNNATDRTTFTPAAPRTLVIGVQYNFTGKK
ncbi:MAG: TonB-dependent receptor [Cyclobacteriaceae bacterium]|nr:TonB-dependent receptor [Cyclobacteriaceae bacterium]